MVSRLTGRYGDDGDDEGRRVWLRAMVPERAAWVAQASPAEIAVEVERTLAEGDGR